MDDLNESSTKEKVSSSGIKKEFSKQAANDNNLSNDQNVNNAVVQSDCSNYSSETRISSNNINGVNGDISNMCKPLSLTQELPEKNIYSSLFNGHEETNETKPCYRYKLCQENLRDNDQLNINTPSTSGLTKNGSSNEASYIKESRKRPSSLKLNKLNLGVDDRSSDSENDDYSLGSEDGCIYTYRGGEHLADLPSSFFSLDMGLPLERNLLGLEYNRSQHAVPNAREPASRPSSPEMDFLEMDFDPGPSCEVETEEESSPENDIEGVNIMPEEKEPTIRHSPEYNTVNPSYSHSDYAPSTSNTKDHEQRLDSLNMPSTSQNNLFSEIEKLNSKKLNIGPYIQHINAKGEEITVRRTMSHKPTNAHVNYHISTGDLVSPREILKYEDESIDSPLTSQINQRDRTACDSSNLSTALYHASMAKKLMDIKTKNNNSVEKANEICTYNVEMSLGEETNVTEVPQTMIWSEQEACERQVTQIGTSACGATAVVNVFTALGVPVNIEKINSAIGTRQRANNAPLPRYLLSRAVAGCTAADLVTGIKKASAGLVTARFFPTYPEKALSLSHWLSDWIYLGAVPILTLNLQAGCEGEMPDAWHHQMVFGVSPRGVYLCNPVECVRESVLWPRLISPSVLLVKAQDVISRFTPDTDLTPLTMVPDKRFHTFNVLGQVASVVREWGGRARHVRLPAAYRAGATLAALTGSEAHKRLATAPGLPSLDHCQLDGSN